MRFLRRLILGEISYQSDLKDQNLKNLSTVFCELLAFLGTSMREKQHVNMYRIAKTILVGSKGFGWILLE